MPYADPERQRAYQQRWELRRRRSSVVHESLRRLLRQANEATTPNQLAALVRPLTRIVATMAKVPEEG